jgi:hypothetical protein
MDVTPDAIFEKRMRTVFAGCLRRNNGYWRKAFRIGRSDGAGKVISSCSIVSNFHPVAS